MPELNSTEQLRLWFRKCPAIQNKNRFRVNFLSESPTEYAIYSVPSEIRTHENIIGEMVLDDIQVQNFILHRKNLSALTFSRALQIWAFMMRSRRGFVSKTRFRTSRISGRAG